MIAKHKLVNFLYLIGFPFYGIGNYVTFTNTFSVGVIFSVIPYLLILVIHFLDLIYKRRLTPMVNGVYWVTTAYIASLISSYWLGHLVFHSFPGLNPININAQSVMFLAPFNAALVVHMYNRSNERFDFAWLTLKSLILLIAVNFVGYVAGIHNAVHGFEGRINLPFFIVMYDGAHVLSIINLMLLFYLKDYEKAPLRFILLALLYVVGLAMMVNINSRLSFMMFLVLSVLFALRLMKVLRGVYAVSLFTMPLLTSFALLIYQVLSMPFFVAILQRVDKEDVTTFNGRTYIWGAVYDWLLEDRRGFFFGNGYHGQYRLRMLDFVADLWGDKHSYNLHMHSTFLEVVMDQGLVGLVLFYLVFWYGFDHFRKKYLADRLEAPLFAAFVYLLFIWQIDIFVSGMFIGFAILMCLMSAASISPRFITRTPRKLDGQPVVEEED